jgi:uncharacterized integral membrane protein (TIGR00698 family)
MSINETAKKILPGLAVSALTAASAYVFSYISFFRALHFSPIVLAIVLGMVIGNAAGSRMPSSWTHGIAFSQKKILRFAIVFYGFRITFQQIAAIGPAGILADVVMLGSTFVIGYFIGTKLLKMDRDTSILCAAGSSICGAAAVLATEPVLKSEPYKVTVAVGTVVIFGTIAMFLYPFLFRLTGFSVSHFGIYIGSTIHEVAQVVAAGDAVKAAESAVIVKLGRVMLLAPFLIILSFFIGRTEEAGEKSKIMIPWFAFFFIAVSGFNSLNLLPAGIVSAINTADTFLLTTAMAALGVDSRKEKFKGVGTAPFLSALLMFFWLVIGGYFINSAIFKLFN